MSRAQIQNLSITAIRPEDKHKWHEKFLSVNFWNIMF